MTNKQTKHNIPVAMKLINIYKCYVPVCGHKKTYSYLLAVNHAPFCIPCNVCLSGVSRSSSEQTDEQTKMIHFICTNVPLLCSGVIYI